MSIEETLELWAQGIEILSHEPCHDTYDVEYRGERFPMTGQQLRQRIGRRRHEDHSP